MKWSHDVAEFSLADLARYARMPMSNNIDDRRAVGPDPITSLQEPMFPPMPVAQGMEGRLPTALSSAAGFNDIPQGDLSLSLLTDIVRRRMRPQGPSAADEFKGEVELMQAEQGSGPYWLDYMRPRGR